MPIGEFLQGWRRRQMPGQDRSELGVNYPPTQNQQGELDMRGALRRAIERRHGSRLDPTHMALSESARSDRILRIRSRLLDEDILFVEDEPLRSQVTDQSMVVYTADELRYLVGIAPEDLVRIHKIKRTFTGTIEKVLEN